MMNKLEGYTSAVVATGTGFYDGSEPRQIDITAYPARYAWYRFVEDDIDENLPIPHTVNGLLYRVGATSGGDFKSISEAKAWADRQPWGPVKWD